MPDLIAQSQNYLMALLEQALGCSATLAAATATFEPCTCDLSGRHFFHHCPTCDLTWVKS